MNLSKPETRGGTQASFFQNMNAPEELRTFCESKQGRLVGMLSLYCGDVELARDFAQEALARVCRDWRRVQKLDNPEAWLHQVALNLSRSYFRKRAVEIRFRARIYHEGTAGPASFPDHAGKQTVRNAVRQLPKNQRAAVVLRYYADWSVYEVAAFLGCPEGTVKTWTARGIETLRRTLADTDWGDMANV